MKNLTLWFTFIILLPSILHAQRSVDISAQMVKPSVGEVIYKNISFLIRVNFKNNGPGDLKTGDTIFYQFKIFGQPLMQVEPIKLPNDVPSGETYTHTWNSFGIGFSSGAENTPFCIESSLRNMADHVSDPNSTNNNTCNNVNLRMSVSVNENLDNKFFELYPNPANQVVFLNLESSEINDIAIEVFDINGKSIIKNKIHNEPGLFTIPVDVSVLTSGLYIIKVSNGTKITNQVLLIQ